jgi:transitional endoplasmic reticulum ATPase
MRFFPRAASRAGLVLTPNNLIADPSLPHCLYHPRRPAKVSQLLAVVPPHNGQEPSAGGTPSLSSLDRAGDCTARNHPHPASLDWAGVCGLGEARELLEAAVLWPLRHAAGFARLGVHPPNGILLYGCPGTGKTLLARAVAKSSQCAFLPVKITDLVHSGVGESEKAVRDLFVLARNSAPCVVFLDEVDAVFASRQNGDVGEKIVAQLLAELDACRLIPCLPEEGVAESSAASQQAAVGGILQPYSSIHSSLLRERVILLAATNLPMRLPPALLRPGRFDRVVYVPPPDFPARMELLQMLKGDRHWELDDAQMRLIAERTRGYTGADLRALMRAAGAAAAARDSEAEAVTLQDFEVGLTRVFRSVCCNLFLIYLM